MYLAICTRPDIMFIVSNFSQFLEQPSRIHWKAAKRVLKYLKGTINFGIEFGSINQPNILTAFRRRL